mmetsp:Transcript_86813/g.268795  ORF Transcript_86813/g.268795 Transcript_86813/m.268795 type:complete len:672 (-) Transcript_86813:37-2052(-)
MGTTVGNWRFAQHPVAAVHSAQPGDASVARHVAGPHSGSITLTVEQVALLLPPALRGAVAAQPTTTVTLPTITPVGLNRAAVPPAVGDGRSGLAPKALDEGVGTSKRLSKAEFEAIVKGRGNHNLVIPLEAKTWSREVLMAFIESEGVIRPTLCSVPDQSFLENRDMDKVDIDKALAQATVWLSTADAILVGSGAGMGVDSGLSTFRGKNAGVWPGLEELGMAYEEICEPHWFQDDPRLAWAFWRFCHDTYQKTKPHRGYELVRDWAAAAPFGAFSFTSNIDGHWEASGWDGQRVVEVHGAVRRLQCSVPCCQEVWQAPSDLGLREDSRRAVGSLPHCPWCGKVARPAVQMFGQDKGFSKQPRVSQAARYDAWLRELASRPDSMRMRIVCLELGCGLTVPTVRRELEDVVKRFPAARLIRVNLEQPGMAKELSHKGVSLPMAAGAAIRRLDEAVRSWLAGPPPAAGKGVSRFCCVVWDKAGGGAEVEAPLGATPEQVLRLLRRQPGVDLDLGPSREIGVTVYHPLVAGTEASVAYAEPVPAAMLADEAGPLKATTLVVQGVRFLSGRSPAIERRLEWANGLLDGVIGDFGSEDFQAKLAEVSVSDRRGVSNLIRLTHAKVLPDFGLPPTPVGVMAMSARIGLLYFGSDDIAKKADRSMELSGMSKANTAEQ